MITVGELIERLKEHDPKLRVMMPGYEGGVRDGPNEFQVRVVALDVNEEWYYGSHEIVHIQYDCYSSAQKIKALIIR